MAREISFSGGDISVLKALGLSGGQVGGKSLVDRLGGMETAEIIDSLDGLIMMDYVQCDTEKLRSADDVYHAQIQRQHRHDPRSARRPDSAEEGSQAHAAAARVSRYSGR